MKKLLFVLLFICPSAVFPQHFDRAWEKIVRLEEQDRIRSASEAVDRISVKATSQKNEAQIIKCFFYQSKYMLRLDENAQSKIITSLHTHIARLSPPSKALLQMVYAKCLDKYLRRNNYRIYGRDAVSGEPDFLTWSTADFTREIKQAFEKSIADKTVLNATPLLAYEAVFDFISVEQSRRETLYDYLLKEYIEFLSAGVFIASTDTQTGRLLFTDTAGFLAADFSKVTTTDALTLLDQMKALEDHGASAEKQLYRITLLGMHSPRDNDYLRALERLEKISTDTSLTQQIQLLKAYYFQEKASKQTAADYLIKSAKTCDSILAVKNRSNAWRSALALQSSIRSRMLTVTLEKFIYPDQNARAFVNFKNVSHISVSYHKIDHTTAKKLSSAKNRDSLIARIRKTAPIAARDYALPDKHDHFDYTTELLLPKISKGIYLAYFESDGNSDNNKAFDADVVVATDLSAGYSTHQKTTLYQIKNRRTGQPVEGAVVNHDGVSVKTDRNGYAAVGTSDTYQPSVQFSIQGDTLPIYRYPYTGYDTYEAYTGVAAEDEEYEFETQLNIYTDRAIYRPGQTVFYKAIAITQLDQRTSAVGFTSFSVTITDPQGDVLKQFDVRTNGFGSLSGEFTIPENTLTGAFAIVIGPPRNAADDPGYNKNKGGHPFWDHTDFDGERVSFQVEEYRRPHFEVSFERISENIGLEQEVIVRGVCHAFDGSAMTNSQVKYTIDCANCGIENSLNHAEGRTTTDQDGKFKIDFTTLPEAKANGQEILSYQIHAEITDLNGETQAASMIVRAGKKSLRINMKVPAMVVMGEKSAIAINATNLNNYTIPVDGTIQVFFIKPDSDKFKNRLFPVPEIQGFSESEFGRLFPYEPYVSDDKPIGDEAGTLVFSKKMNTAAQPLIATDFLSGFTPGHYRLVFSAEDANHNTAGNSASFVLKQNDLPIDPSRLLSIAQINKDPKKDGFVLFRLSSPVSELFVNIGGFYDSQKYFDNDVALQQHQTQVKIPVNTAFRDNVIILFECVFDNLPYHFEKKVDLPATSPKMVFTVDSFRSKIQPGMTENWTFTIKAGDDPGQSEILATMFDRSLDAFRRSDWNSFDFGEDQNEASEMFQLGFATEFFSLRNLNDYMPRFGNKPEKTDLIWFGFDINNDKPDPSLYRAQITKKAKKPKGVTWIRGTVTDQNYPLPGVKVTVKGTIRSTQTDLEGYYEIEAAPGESLEFDLAGFTPQAVVAEAPEINITLHTTELDTVEINTGYRAITKRGNASAIAVLEERANASVLQHLQGRVSGLNVTSGSGQPGSDTEIILRGTGSIDGSEPLFIVDGVAIDEKGFRSLNQNDIDSITVLKDAAATALYGNRGSRGVIVITTKNNIAVVKQVTARKNLKETAFFFPHLTTGPDGKLTLRFTAPEALTEWRFRMLAHNRDGVTGQFEENITTQKELMITPNFPRFFREKDTVEVVARITNLSNTPKSGLAILMLYDASTMKSIDAIAENTESGRNFTVTPMADTAVRWKITVPSGIQSLQYKVVAKAGDFSDGEENAIAVLPNAILVTESLPLWVRENSARTYTLGNLKNYFSGAARQHSLTVEYTSNPAWLAIQSLPYLMEYEHDCAEQAFSRYYANAIAAKIISDNPKIAAVFESWKATAKTTPMPGKNDALKSIALSETPWGADGISETDRNRRPSALFDLRRLQSALSETVRTLSEKQKPSGGFGWFDGSPEDDYITRHILSGLGHLRKLGVQNPETEAIIDKAIKYSDAAFLKNPAYAESGIGFRQHACHDGLHYLYMRSFFLKDHPLPGEYRKRIALHLKSVAGSWQEYSIYEKGLAALVLFRFEEKADALRILASLKETASNNTDWGMYWIENKPGWNWYQSPVETQALLIEAFTEISDDTKSADAMKVWLLKNKQRSNWPSTKSTTEAIYALLMHGSDWTDIKDNTVFTIGDEKIASEELSENEKEAETGYIKRTWKPEEISKNMATLAVENNSKVPGFGGFYRQYLEDIDQIKASDSPLSVIKTMYLNQSGKDLQKITSQNPLKVGELVTIRLVVTANEDVEYIHLKDLRASCFEPVDVLSGYEWKDGVGFYKSTKDTATHFFFAKMLKGTYVFQYDVRVNNAGDFATGIATVESLYAPEFSSHSTGIRIGILREN
ncbi:MG2 domain-containing protein [Flavobacterium magnum]|nr:alpha-2-macroglobulin family protein [Flavobacterium magnum]